MAARGGLSAGEKRRALPGEHTQTHTAPVSEHPAAGERLPPPGPLTSSPAPGREEMGREQGGGREHPALPRTAALESGPGLAAAAAAPGGGLTPVTLARRSPHAALPARPGVLHTQERPAAARAAPSEGGGRRGWDRATALRLQL